MKNLISIIVSAVLFFGFVTWYHYYLDSRIEFDIKNHREAIVYWDEEYRFDVGKRDTNIDAISEILDDNTCIVMGSSELHAVNDLSFPTILYKNNEAVDFDTFMIGDSYCQSLVHALEVGALDDDIPRKKLVLILSPQWFETSQPSSIFCRLFNYNAFVSLLKNESISRELKWKVSERVISQLVEDNQLKEKAQRACSVYLNNTKNPVKLASVAIENAFQLYKSKYQLYSVVRKMDIKSEPNSKKVDYDKLAFDGDRIHKEKANNEFHALDGYYDFWQNSDFLQKDCFRGYEFSSSEYDDLELFLSVCSETNTNVLVVNVPCQGWVYDYLGWSQEARDNYYEKIREICLRNGAQVADFSDQEYNEGFIRDSMHLGYEGWALVNKSIYDFFD